MRQLDAMFRFHWHEHAAVLSIVGNVPINMGTHKQTRARHSLAVKVISYELILKSADDSALPAH